MATQASKDAEKSLRVSFIKLKARSGSVDIGFDGAKSMGLSLGVSPIIPKLLQVSFFVFFLVGVKYSKHVQSPPVKTRFKVNGFAPGPDDGPLLLVRVNETSL